MSTMKSFVTSMTVIPEGEALYSERGTTIRIEDESGGPFLVIEQHPDTGTQALRFDCEEWETINDAVNHMILMCRHLKENEENSQPIDISAESPTL